MSGNQWPTLTLELKPGATSFFLKFQSDGSTEYWGYKFKASTTLHENVTITETSWASDLKRCLGLLNVISIYPMMRVPPPIPMTATAVPSPDGNNPTNTGGNSNEDESESLEKFAIMQAVMEDPLIRFGLLPDSVTRFAAASAVTAGSASAGPSSSSAQSPHRKLLLDCVEGIGDGKRLSDLMRNKCRARDRGKNPAINKAARAVAVALIHHHGLGQQASMIVSAAGAAFLKDKVKSREIVGLWNAAQSTRLIFKTRKQDLSNPNQHDDLSADIVEASQLLLSLHPEVIGMNTVQQESGLSDGWSVLSSLRASSKGQGLRSTSGRTHMAWSSLAEEAASDREKLRALISLRRAVSEERGETSASLVRRKTSDAGLGGGKVSAVEQSHKDSITKRILSFVQNERIDLKAVQATLQGRTRAALQRAWAFSELRGIIEEKAEVSQRKTEKGAEGVLTDVVFMESIALCLHVLQGAVEKSFAKAGDSDAASSLANLSGGEQRSRHFMGSLYGAGLEAQQKLTSEFALLLRTMNSLLKRVSTELVRVENDMEKMKEAQKKTVAAKGERKGEAKEEEAKEEAVSHPGVVAAEKAATSINFWTVNNFFQKTMADGSSAAAADIRTTARVNFDSYCGIDGDTNHEGVLSLTDLDVMLRHFFDHLIQTFTDPERFVSAHFNIPDRVLLDEVLRARFRLERLRFRLLAQGWLSMMIHKDVEHISNVCRDYIDGQPFEIPHESTVTWEQWKFEMNSHEGFFRGFLLIVQPTGPGSSQPQIVDTSDLARRSPFFADLENIVMPVEKAALSSREAQNGAQNELSERLSKLEWLRRVVASTCGLDYNIEDDVIVAGSGLMDSIRGMLVLNDTKVTRVVKSGESLSIALLRLLVERFMPAVHGSFFGPSSSSSSSSSRSSNGETLDTSGATLLTTAIQPQIIDMLGDLLSSVLPSSSMKSRILTVPVAATCLPVPSEVKDSDFDGSLITVMDGNPLCLSDARKRGGHASCLTNYHTVCFDLLLLDAPASLDPSQSSYIGLFSKGISGQPSKTLKKTKNPTPGGGAATHKKRARTKTRAGSADDSETSGDSDRTGGLHTPCQNFGLRLKRDTHELEIFFTKEFNPAEDSEPPLEVVTKTVAGRVPIGTWCRIAFVLDKCVSEIYINGKLEGKGDIQDSGLRSFIRASKATQALNSGPICLGKAAFCSNSESSPKKLNTRCLPDFSQDDEVPGYIANVQVNPHASWKGEAGASAVAAPVVMPRVTFDAARALRVLALVQSALVSAARHDVVVNSGIRKSIFRLAFCGGHFQSRSIVCGLRVPARVVIAAHRVAAHLLASMDPEECTEELRELGCLKQKNEANEFSTISELDLSSTTPETLEQKKVENGDADRTRPESAAEFLVWSLGQALCTWVPSSSNAKGGIEAGGIDGASEADRQALAQERAMLIRQLCASPTSAWRDQLMAIFRFALSRVADFVAQLKQKQNENFRIGISTKVPSLDISSMNFSSGGEVQKEGDINKEDPEQATVMHRDHCLILSALCILGGEYDRICVGASVVNQTTELQVEPSTGFRRSPPPKKKKKTVSPSLVLAVGSRGRVVLSQSSSPTGDHEENSTDNVTVVPMHSSKSRIIPLSTIAGADDALGLPDVIQDSNVDSRMLSAAFVDGICADAGMARQVTLTIETLLLVQSRSASPRGFQGAILTDLIARASIVMQTLAEHSSACERLLSPILPAIVSIAKLDSDFLHKETTSMQKTESDSKEGSDAAFWDESAETPFSAAWWLRITDSDSRLIASKLSWAMTENWCDSTPQPDDANIAQDDLSRNAVSKESLLSRALSYAQTDRETCLLLDDELEQYNILVDPVKADLQSLLNPSEEVLASHQIKLRQDKIKVLRDGLAKQIPYAHCPKGHCLVDKGVVNAGWNCDGRHDPEGCRTMQARSISGFGGFPGGQRFRCDQCDFDYCGMCNVFHVKTAQSSRETTKKLIQDLEAELSSIVVPSIPSSSSKESESKVESKQEESKNASVAANDTRTTKAL